MENQKKVTKKEQFAQLKALVLNTDAENKDALIEFIDHEVELLNKKSATKSKKDVAKSEENGRLVDLIEKSLENGKKTVSELIASIEDLRDFSTPKVSALVKIGITEGRFVRTEEKGKAYFSLA